MADPAVPVVTCESCGAKNRVPAAAAGRPRCGRCHAPLPWIADADEATFDEVVEASPVPVLLDLWAPWCGPCHMVSPALEELAREHAGQLKLVKVNVDEAPAVARRFEVQGIPTLIVRERGQTLAHQAGASSSAALRTWLDQALSRAATAGDRTADGHAASARSGGSSDPGPAP